MSKHLQALESRLFLAAQGYDWRAATIKGNGFIDGIVYSPAAPNVLYMHTDMGGAYRWDQGANRWMPMNDWSRWDDWSPQNMGVETMAVDPTDPTRVYMAAGTYMSPTAILRSTDGGRTWQRTDVSGINSNGNGSARNAGERMIVDPNSPNILYYGTRDDGLWTSTNLGQSWTPVASFPTIGEDSGFTQDTGIVWVLVDKNSATPGNPSQTIYAGVVVRTAGLTRIYRSTDGGTSWAALPGGQPTTANFFPQRAVLTPDGSSLFLTYGFSTSSPGPFGLSNGLVYRVTSPAAVSPTWTNVTPSGTGGGGFSGVALDPTNPSVVYVTKLNRHPDDIWRSTTSGSSWTPLGVPTHTDNSSAAYAGSMGQFNTPHWVGDLQVDPFNQNVGMLTTGYGLYRTTNLTAATPTWSFFNEGFEQSAILELVSPNTGSVNLLSVQGDRDGFRHDNFAVSPALGRFGQNQPDLLTSDPNDTMAKGTTDDIDAAWNDANFVVRVVRTSPYVQYSLDNAQTWAWFPATTGGGDGGDNGNIALSTDGTRAVFEPSGGGTLRYAIRTGSSWGTWTTPTSGTPANNSMVVADLVNPLTFYAYAGTTVSRSTDGGANWTVMTSSAPNFALHSDWVRAIPGNAGHLVVSDRGNGVWRSVNGGATWTQLLGGVSTANQVGVGAGPTPGSYPSIYIGGTVSGQTGFFRSDNQGASWTMISDLAHQFGFVTVIQGDSRVYGRLYVGTNGRGVQVADIHQGPTTLPAGWSTQDINSQSTATGAGELSGTFELIGAGNGVPAPGSTSDQFRFVHQTLDGDGTITARVMDVPNGSPGTYLARAGVMMRASLAANSPNAFVSLSQGSVFGVRFQARATAGGQSPTHGSATLGIWPPYWVRLTRVGNDFTAFASPDGVTWTQLGPTQTIAMGPSVFVGLAVTSGSNNQVNVSTFQNVTVEPATADTNAPTVSNAVFSFETTPNKISFTFSEDVSASMLAGDHGLTLTRIGAGTVTPIAYAYDTNTNTATFTLPTSLADGNYRATFSGVSDPAGNPLNAAYYFDFFVLGGDANRNRTVDIDDLNILTANWLQSPRTFSQGDFSGDGIVDRLDLSTLSANWQTTLPEAPPPAGPAVTTKPASRPARRPALVASSPVQASPSRPAAIFATARRRDDLITSTLDVHGDAELI